MGVNFSTDLGIPVYLPYKNISVSNTKHENSAIIDKAADLIQHVLPKNT